MNYEKEIERLLQPLSRQFCVRYALAVAKDVYPLIRDEDRDVVKACLDTVESWLKGKATAREVKAARDEAWAAFHAAYAASHAAATASLAASVASAASHTAYIASRAASAASYAASYAASQPYKKGMEKYYSLLIEMIRDLSETEKILWGIV